MCFQWICMPRSPPSSPISTGGGWGELRRAATRGRRAGRAKRSGEQGSEPASRGERPRPAIGIRDAALRRGIPWVLPSWAPAPVRRPEASTGGGEGAAAAGRRSAWSLMMLVLLRRRVTGLAAGAVDGHPRSSSSSPPIRIRRAVGLSVFQTLLLLLAFLRAGAEYRLPGRRVLLRSSKKAQQQLDKVIKPSPARSSSVTLVFVLSMLFLALVAVGFWSSRARRRARRRGRYPLALECAAERADGGGRRDVDAGLIDEGEGAAPGSSVAR